MKTWNILNAEAQDYSRKAYQILCELGPVTKMNLTQEELPAHVADCEILIVRLGLNINSAIMDAAPRLRYIVSATTGTDHIDLEAARQRNIEVVCLKGETAFLESIPSTAEHTWALLLALLRKIPQACTHVMEGGWDRQRFRGNNLAGKKLGILGLGRVGKQVARYALAFGCETAAFDPYLKIWPDPQIKRYNVVADLLQWCDILCIHIPHNPANHHFLDSTLLAHLKPGAMLINTSRSGIWDEAAVVEALETRRISALATDVVEYEREPEIRNRGFLLQYAQTHDHVVITPHIAGATFESMEMTEVFIVNKLTDIIKNDWNLS